MAEGTGSTPGGGTKILQTTQDKKMFQECSWKCQMNGLTKRGPSIQWNMIQPYKEGNSGALCNMGEPWGHYTKIR